MLTEDSVCISRIFYQCILHGRQGDFCPILSIVVDLLFFRGLLNNMTTSFSDTTFTGLALKNCFIAFTAKGWFFKFLSPLNPINNSSRLNSQMIATNYFYQFLLKIVTEERNHIIPEFIEGV